MSVTVIVFRLVLAVLLSGLVGMEREFKSRPAGFRTHILVCVGAALVMLTSEYTFLVYHTMANMDPTRLGAQVISGIGFLGAGTIIRQGASIKGLTTAASLWAMACVGLAVGAGFYAGAIAGAVVIYLTLIFLSKIGMVLESKSSHLTICVEIDNTPGKIGEIGIIFGKYGANIRNIEFLNKDDLEDNEVTIKFVLKVPHSLVHEKLIREIAELEGVRGVEKI